MTLKSSPIKGNDVRLPEPREGEALVVERYSAEHVKAVILHPSDYEELSALAEMLGEITTAMPELTELAAEEHRRAEEPEGALIDDAATVARLLGA